jgi:hypothetical protein
MNSKAMFPRISTGERNGIQTYRICEIRTLKNYHRKHSFGIHITKKSLMINLNRKKEIFRMILVSNKQFRTKEFEIWCKNVKYTNTLTSSSEKLQDLVVKRHYYRKKIYLYKKKYTKNTKTKIV